MTREKVKGVLDRIPSYVQTIIAIGGIVFSVGILYGDVQDIKRELVKAEGSAQRQGEMALQISVMQAQLAASKETADRTMTTLDNINNTLGRLSVSVARLEGKVEANKKNKSDE